MYKIVHDKRPYYDKRIEPIIDSEWDKKWRWDPVFMQNGTIQTAILNQKTAINNTATALNNKIHYTIGG